eukprot:8288921-Karenia_brevis.AAC.1
MYSSVNDEVEQSVSQVRDGDISTQPIFASIRTTSRALILHYAEQQLEIRVRETRSRALAAAVQQSVEKMKNMFHKLHVSQSVVSSEGWEALAESMTELHVDLKKAAKCELAPAFEQQVDAAKTSYAEHA